MRELRNNLSRYLDRVKAGDEVIVTDRGRPVARLSQVDQSTDRLAELIAAGLAQPAIRRTRSAHKARIRPTGSVSALVRDQRR